MAILEKNYSFYFDKKIGWKMWLSLVTCDHLDHEGPRERLILRKSAVRGRGVNRCRYCAVVGYKHSDNTRKKLSDGRKGENNSFFGKKHTQETKDTIALARLGKPRSEESCAKQSKSMSGENHYKWRHDLTKEDRETYYDRHYNPENHSWRKSVYERDSYTCQITGQKGDGDLVAHHLFGYTAYPELRYIIDNGVTLLESIHKLFHSIYGNNNNTKQQFEEFKSGLQYHPFLFVYYKVFVEKLDI